MKLPQFLLEIIHLPKRELTLRQLPHTPENIRRPTHGPHCGLLEEGEPSPFTANRPLTPDAPVLDDLDPAVRRETVEEYVKANLPSPSGDLAEESPLPYLGHGDKVGWAIVRGSPSLLLEYLPQNLKILRTIPDSRRIRIPG
jgi:hypothetical protein